MTTAVASAPLIFERDPLFAALQTLQRIVERQNVIPILANILLRSKGNAVRLTSTDLGLAATIDVPADAGLMGAEIGVTVPCATLHEIVRHVAEGAQVSLDWRPGGPTLQLRSGRGRWTLPTLPAEDYPQLDAVDMPVSFAMPAADLSRILTTAEFSIASDKTRLYLNGLYLHVHEDGTAKLRAVATNGHHLARDQVDLPEGAEAMRGIILPPKTVAEFRRLLGAARTGEEAELSASDSKIRLRVGATELVSKLVEAAFPDYGRIIPQGNDKLIVVPKAMLAGALDRVAAIKNERDNLMRLDAAAGAITLRRRAPDGAEAVDEVEATVEADTAFAIGFSGKYLREILDHVSGDTVRIRIGTFAGMNSDPILIEPADDAPQQFLLMPMQLKD